MKYGVLVCVICINLLANISISGDEALIIKENAVENGPVWSKNEINVGEDGGNETNVGEDGENDQLDLLWDELNITETSNRLNDVIDETCEVRVDFNQIARKLSEGKIKEAFIVLKDGLISKVIYEIDTNKSLMLELIMVMLLGALFSNLAMNKSNGLVNEQGFFVTYLIISSIVMASFEMSIDVVKACLASLISCIKVLLPLYLVALNFIGLRTSAQALYGIMMALVYVVEVVIQKIILPLIEFYVVLKLVNNLSKEDAFSKMGSLVKQVVTWGLKTMLSLTVGINIIKNMVTPAIDDFNNNQISRIVSSLPGGGVAAGLVGTFLGAGRIVKNSVGAAGIIVLSVVVLSPIIKLLIILLMGRVTEAITQPVSDKRYTEAVAVLGDGMTLLLFSIGTAVCMFMISIAIIAGTSVQ